MWIVRGISWVKSLLIQWHFGLMVNSETLWLHLLYATHAIALCAAYFTLSTKIKLTLKCLIFLIILWKSSKKYWKFTDRSSGNFWSGWRANEHSCCKYMRCNGDSVHWYPLGCDVLTSNCEYISGFGYSCSNRHWFSHCCRMEKFHNFIWNAWMVTANVEFVTIVWSKRRYG